MHSNSYISKCQSQINPDSGKGYKFHGLARAMFGQCEEGQEAAKDLHVTLKLDYDEEINVVLENFGLYILSCNMHLLHIFPALD